jgi:hypothetical protein
MTEKEILVSVPLSVSGNTFSFSEPALPEQSENVLGYYFRWSLSVSIGFKIEIACVFAVGPIPTWNNFNNYFSIVMASSLLKLPHLSVTDIRKAAGILPFSPSVKCKVM